MNKKIAITTGDVNGIGAEITIKALNSLNLDSDNIVIISNKAVLNNYGKLKNNYEIENVDFDMDKLQEGEISAESGDFAFKCLQRACNGVKEGKYSAIVTAPVSKECLHLAGHKFSGQTEILENFLAHDGQKAEMLFVANDFRVLLLTMHLALKDVLVNKDEIIKKIVNLRGFFAQTFGQKSPKFALCGLNPHSGENGILGNEEINIIIPAVDDLRKIGIDITYPKPADTLFVSASRAYLNNKKTPYDCYIAMYHDQGLIPIKAVAFDKTVNMTIGLDVIRTSPSHGTAFDIAGENIADESSMIEAIRAVL